MPSLDEIKNQFGHKLDTIRGEHETRLEAVLEVERERALARVQPSLPKEVIERMNARAAELDRAMGGSRSSTPKLGSLGRIDLSGSDALQELDRFFADRFNLGHYYPVQKLAYPTLYCETLPEFYKNFVQDLNLSPISRQNELQRLVQEAEETAQKTHGGGIFGVDIPGKGCYLNGWLFAWGKGISPVQAFQSPPLLLAILGTAAHEKLGHGFLSVYSALGQAKTRLGLTLEQIARQFGVREADDSLSSQRQRQAGLLFFVSQFLEEGYATWIETYLGSALNGKPGPRYTLQQVMQTVQRLPEGIEQREAVVMALMEDLGVVFAKDSVSLDALHQAMKRLALVSSALDEVFGELLGQPLRYAVGELLFSRTASGLGESCVPYAALVAGNVDLNLERVGLADLQALLAGDPRLHPDTRLAAISQITLERKNDPREMANKVEAALSLSVPHALKR